MYPIHEITEDNFKEERKDTTVDKKIEKYHEIAKLKWKNKKIEAELADLWKDPTIWSYASHKVLIFYPACLLRLHNSRL